MGDTGLGTLTGLRAPPELLLGLVSPPPSLPKDSRFFFLPIGGAGLTARPPCACLPLPPLPVPIGLPVGGRAGSLCQVVVAYGVP